MFSLMAWREKMRKKKLQANRKHEEPLGLLPAMYPQV
jgi:hypothetical protein